MKIIKDERIKEFENKYMAEAYVIMMVLAFIYIIADSFHTNLGFFKENMVLVLFMVGALYIVVRLTSKGLSSYSPIKGLHPVAFTTILCLSASVFYGIVLTIKNTNLYLHGKYSWQSIVLFFIGTIGMFFLTEVVCLVMYFISKKREEKEIKD